MTDRADDGAVAVAVEAVWEQLRPAVERHYAVLAGPGGDHLANRRRRHVRRVVAGGLAVAVVGAGSAVAARALLGDPAPPAVRSSISAVDEGMPADLRLQPDVAHARSVARDGDAVLYAADLKDGGECTELALAGRPAGAICVRGGAERSPIDASIPGTPEDVTSPVVVGGRINVAADHAALVLDGGRQIPMALEPGGYFVAALGATDSATARRGLAVQATLDGALVASVDLSDAFTPERPSAEPISLELVSGDGDLVAVVAVHGSVTVPGAVAVRLVYPDGEFESVPIGPGGRYDLVLPVERRGALAERPGRIVAIDADGHELASRAVAAVSWWRAHQRG